VGSLEKTWHSQIEKPGILKKILEKTWNFTPK
jgi:hypothetical protein